ncbi:MAG: prephenate dehydratase [Cytophagales bacterium]|nr:prephenate dehydratase [Cytophagales bacterium]
MKSLSQLRTEIDAVDQQILALLNQRAALAHAVGEVKKLDGSPVFRPDREAAVIAKMQAAQSQLKPEGIAAIWREVMSACRALEETQKVAFLGPKGTYSEEAAIEFFGSSMGALPCQSIDEVFRATASGGAEFGVVPIENSTEGVIARTMDLLLASNVHIVGNVSLKVRHNLLRHSSDSMDGITAVYGHPQALAQCHAWLSQHLPHAERRVASSNAEGARQARLDQAFAAIASSRAATEFGLQTVAKAIQDEAHNRTRFAVICRPEVLPIPEKTGNDAISLVVSVKNQPGALHDLLVPLKTHGVSMTRFESRPARSAEWEYNFYIDLVGHLDDAAVSAALAELQTLCAFYKVLGCYPAATS